MTDKKSALPYASQYPQQEPGMIKHLLLEAGMEVNDDFKEPTDHGDLSGITQPFTFFIG